MPSSPLTLYCVSPGLALVCFFMHFLSSKFYFRFQFSSVVVAAAAAAVADAIKGDTLCEYKTRLTISRREATTNRRPSTCRTNKRILHLNSWVESMLTPTKLRCRTSKQKNKYAANYDSVHFFLQKGNMDTNFRISMIVGHLGKRGVTCYVNV